jgi:hypothetical protein
VREELIFQIENWGTPTDEESRRLQRLSASSCESMDDNRGVKEIWRANLQRHAGLGERVLSSDRSHGGQVGERANAFDQAVEGIYQIMIRFLEAGLGRKELNLVRNFWNKLRPERKS